MPRMGEHGLYATPSAFRRLLPTTTSGHYMVGSAAVLRPAHKPH